MKYTIGRKIGSGKFGKVYEARDALGNRYAVKLSEPGESLAPVLLLGQFQFLSSVCHARIARAIEFDLDSESGPMLITELVDGVDLATFVEMHGIGDLVLLTAKILDALRYLHSVGKVHGDLKPDSILVTGDGSDTDIKLVDGGFDYGKGSKLPTLEGTLPYLAPEVIRNLPGDGRSDLYSLGAVLYELLTGTRPFGGAAMEEILRKQLEYVPDAPTRVNPGLPKAWDEFVGMLLEKEPLVRYRNAVHAGLELQRLFGRPTVFLDSFIPPHCPPLVGRDEILVKIEAHIDAAHGKVLAVCGERGAGVSRILHHAGTVAMSRGLKTHWVTLKSGMPAYVQIIEAVSQREGLEGEIRREPDDEPPRSTESEFAGLMRGLQAGLLPGRQHYLIVDRGEAVDSRELMMLGALARELQGQVTIAVGYQPDACPGDESPEARAFELVSLEPLSLDAVEATVKSYFGLSALPAGLAEDLHHATGGNPGLLEVTLKHLWESGDLRLLGREAGLELGWSKTVAMPKTVKEVVDRKLSNLSDRAMELLRLVWIGTGQIETSVLQVVYPDEMMGPAMTELLASGLIEHAEATKSVRLKWQSLAEAIGQRTRPEHSRDLSLQLAGVLEAIPGRVEDHFRLGVLYFQAGQKERAFDHLVKAGDSFSRYSSRDAILAYTQALECGVEPERSMEIEESIGDLKFARDDLDGAMDHFERASASRPSSRRKLAWVLGGRGRAAEAVRMLKQCRTIARRNADEIEEARILSDLGYIYANQGRRDLALSSLRRARRLFEKNEDPLGPALVATRIGIVEHRAGNFKRALRAHEDARTGFEKAGDARRAGVALFNLGLCYWRQMDMERADACLKEALSTFERLKLPFERAACCQNYAGHLLERGELGRARHLAEEALGVFRLVSRGLSVASVTILLAAISIEAGNWREAEKRLTQLLRGSEPLSPFMQAMITRYLARTGAIRGDFDRAMSLVEQSHDYATQADDADGRGQALLETSKICLRFGHEAEALDAARKAQSALTLSSSMIRVNEAQRVIGEALCLAGRHGEAIPLLLDAMEGFSGIPWSINMGRVYRALSLAYHLGGDRDSFSRYLTRSVEVFRAAGARYDYACAILLGSRGSLADGHLLQARHYAVEAARIFETLGIDDLNKKAVEVMEQIPSGELEVKAITSLSEISQTLSSSRDLTTVLNLAMDLAIEYLGAERGVLLLEDEATGDLATFVERGMDKETLQEVIGISRSVVESVRSTGESVIAGDATKDPRFKDSKSVRTHNIMSVMCVPLKVGDRVLGMIYLDSRGVPSGLSSLERAFVDAFANQVSLAVKNAQFYGRLHDDVIDLRIRAGERYSFPHIIGPGKRMQEVFRQVDRAAKSDITVLISGESGTGKELIAGLVHQLSPRNEGPLVRIDLAAISRDLMESELFGIEKRVATGVSPRTGVFERAHGGTIFLDEVGNMPLDTQTKLLRFLDQQEFQRVGGSRLLKVDVRVISATNKNLKELIKQDVFRPDLYFRLNAMPIHLPPLRERLDGLRALVDYFVEKYAARNSRPRMQVSKEVLDLFRIYPWPGNVRELETCIQHAVVSAPGERIEVQHLRDEILEAIVSKDIDVLVGPYGGTSLPEAVRKLETKLIGQALHKANGVKTSAARSLGIHESTLRKKIKQLGLDKDQV